MAKLTEYTRYADAQAHADSNALWALFEGAETFVRILLSDGRRTKLFDVRVDDPALTARVRAELTKGDRTAWTVQTDRENPTPCVLLDFRTLGA